MRTTNGFIALDIGNVCFNIDFSKCFEALPFDRDGFLSKYEDLYIKHETGNINDADFIETLFAWTEPVFTREQILNLFSSIIGEEIPGMSDIIKELVDKKYNVAFFSDTSPLHIYEVTRKLSFSNLIIGGVYSFEVGTLKPSPAMYNEFERRYGKPALYIDDKAVNCSEAEKRGWPVHCFTCPDGLKAMVGKM